MKGDDHYFPYLLRCYPLALSDYTFTPEYTKIAYLVSVKI